jgi:hypothetical protein
MPRLPCHASAGITDPGPLDLRITGRKAGVWISPPRPRPFIAVRGGLAQSCQLAANVDADHSQEQCRLENVTDVLNRIAGYQIVVSMISLMLNGGQRAARPSTCSGAGAAAPDQIAIPLVANWREATLLIAPRPKPMMLVDECIGRAHLDELLAMISQRMRML